MRLIKLILLRVNISTEELIYTSRKHILCIKNNNMKQALLFLGIMMVGFAAHGVMAHPGIATVVQPDNSRIDVRLLGDEFFSYETTVDMYTIVKDTDGFYKYATATEGKLTPSAMIAHNEDDRSKAEKRFLNTLPKMCKPANSVNAARKERDMRDRNMAVLPNSGFDYDNFRGLVILVEFNDREFSEPNADRIFHDMINQEEYRGFISSSGKKEEYRGSVKDYFRDNSCGKFIPSFDVVGPVKINRSQTFPQGSDNRNMYIPESLIAADSLVDYSRYDIDKDGIVDMVYFIYAGAGANYSGNNRGYVWPHAANVPWSKSLDGVKFGRYACSTELYGIEADGIIDGIGTICHEFSHCLGLYDIYDTDYETSGLSLTPLDWSVMASGNYLDNARTPCGYSLFERIESGFATAVNVDREMEVELPHIATSNTGYRIDTPIKDEYFLLENRQQEGWDKYLPGHGLLVFRVDKTNPQVWERNKINCDPRHNYYELVRGEISYNVKGEAIDGPGDPFPGTGNIHTLSSLTAPALRSWTGMETCWAIRDITESSDGRIMFDIVRDEPDIILEDFETCAETDGADTYVDGIIKGWQLNGKAKITVAASDTASNKHVSTVMGSSIVSPVISTKMEFIRMELKNPTNYTSVFRCEYQPEGSTVWHTLSTIDGMTECSVKAKKTEQPIFSCGFESPGRFRVRQTTGNKESSVDNVGIYLKRDITTGIGSVSMSDSSSKRLCAYSHGGMLDITCRAGIPVRIFSIDGTRIAAITPAGNHAAFHPQAEGIYIITQGEENIKVIVKSI